MSLLSVLIPSRLARGKDGHLFLEHALRSISEQAGYAGNVQILVGVDAGAVPPADLAGRPGVTFVESAGKSQAAALNAAAQKAEGEFVAILEDDDRWSPSFLMFAFRLLNQDFDFFSTTQLEVLEDTTVIQIGDYPIPSTWVMRRALWDKVGLFNEEYRFHLDNEWLGRLGETEASRVHALEATAPMDYGVMKDCRPFLAKLVRNAKPKLSLARHDSPWPLVARLSHPGSGMAQLGINPDAQARSELEQTQLINRFGHSPW